MMELLAPGSVAFATLCSKRPRDCSGFILRNSRLDMETNVMTLLAGKSACELHYGKVAIGCGDDLSKAAAQIRRWVEDAHTYTVRFGLGMLMSFYLDEDFKPEYIEIVAEVESEEYYVNMMIAWYLATALAKQWDATIPYLEERKLSPWVHRKTIQKAVESYRITDEQKVYLKTLRENC